MMVLCSFPLCSLFAAVATVLASAQSDGTCTGGLACKDKSLSECANSIHGCNWVGQGGNICTGGLVCKDKSMSECVKSIHGCKWELVGTQSFGGGQSQGYLNSNQLQHQCVGMCTGGPVCKDKSLSMCSNSIHGCNWVGEGGFICTGSPVCKGKSISDCVNSIHSCKWELVGTQSQQCFESSYWQNQCYATCAGGSLCKGESLPECANSVHGCNWVGQGDFTCTGGLPCKRKSMSECVNSAHSCKWEFVGDKFTWCGLLQALSASAERRATTSIVLLALYFAV